jgi:hypothetical protein
VTASTQPTILIIDDDAAIGRSLKRLSEQAFPGCQIIWVKNGVTGIELARQYADQLPQRVSLDKRRWTGRHPLV